MATSSSIFYRIIRAGIGVFSAFRAWQKSCSCPIFRTQSPLPNTEIVTLHDTMWHYFAWLRLKICYSCGHLRQMIIFHVLQFPNAVVLNAVGRRNTQMRANERNRVQMSAKERKRKSAKEQKGSKERRRALPRKSCKQPGLKQPGLGTPDMWVPINYGNRSGSCSESSHCTTRETPSENGTSHSENYFLNSESCSENTPERSQSSENSLFTPRAFFPEVGVLPGFWLYPDLLFLGV